MVVSLIKAIRGWSLTSSAKLGQMNPVLQDLIRRGIRPTGEDARYVSTDKAGYRYYDQPMVGPNDERYLTRYKVAPEDQGRAKERAKKADDAKAREVLDRWALAEMKLYARRKLLGLDSDFERPPGAWLRTCRDCGAPNIGDAESCRACESDLLGAALPPPFMPIDNAQAVVAATKHYDLLDDSDFEEFVAALSFDDWSYDPRPDSNGGHNAEPV